MNSCFVDFFFSVFLLSISLICWAQWHMPVNPNPREAKLRSCLSHRVGSRFEIFFFEFSLLSLLFPFMFLFCNYSARFLASSPEAQMICFRRHVLTYTLAARTPSLCVDRLRSSVLLLTCSIYIQPKVIAHLL